MSKSDIASQSKILLTSSPHEIRHCISRALTDSIHGIYADPQRPGITNLLQILAAFQNTTIPELETQVRDMKMSHFKTLVAESIINGLSPIQARYEEVRQDPSWLEKLQKGMKKLNKSQANE
jgi:tryptophanyl-tRNA synthetase